MESASSQSSSGASDPREIELKLHAPPASVARLWAIPLVVEHAVGPKRIARVDNRYFDTSERDLATRRMALRLRRTGRNWLQTLKTQGLEDGALSVRSEWEMPVAGPALQLTKLRDTPLSSIASARSLTRRLQPVFTTNFRRESRILRLRDGCEIELALDVGSIVAGRGKSRRSLPICEVELEVKVRGADDPAVALLRFARRLCRDLPLIPLGESKAARGYRLADALFVDASRVMLPVPDGHDPAALHLSRVVAACAEALLANVHALMERRPGEDPAVVDPEFVHQARVAIRRLRSALRTFRPLAKGRRFDVVEDELTALGRTFGDVRDWDVFASTALRRLGGKVGIDDAGRAALAELVAQVETRRSDAYRVLLTRLDEGPFGAIAIDLMRIARGLEADAATAGPTLADRVPRWLDEQRERIVRLSRRIAILDNEERHALRVEVKRLRYGLDLFVGMFDPARVDGFQDALSELQTKLGRLNDEVVADRLLRSFEPGSSRDLIAARFGAWLDQHIRKQLPKVAALSVAFELTHEPWSREPPRRFGSSGPFPRTRAP
jgi:inorganic triphosphatase YgiF